MSHWVRLWEDMPNDPKWRVIARRAKQSVGDVIAVFNHMMINAGLAKSGGVLENWNDEVVATALDVEPAHVTAIREAMQGFVLDGDRLRGWDKRQTKREDESAERSKARRDLQKALDRIAELEAQMRDTGNPVMDDQQPHPTASDRVATATDQQNRIEENKRKKDISAKGAETDFENLRSKYPWRPGDAAALAKKALAKALKKPGVTIDVILAGAAAYKEFRNGEDPKFTKTLSAWLNAEMWDTDWTKPRGQGPPASNVDPVTGLALQ